MGRSGSTLCWRAISQSLAVHRYGAAGRLMRKTLGKRLRDEAWDLGNDQMFPGYVYKTHALANELPVDFDGHIVFLFGLASDAALSVISCRERYGDDWLVEHFRHLRAIGSFEELCNRDVLQFGRQIDTWINLQGHDVLALRYETLWDNVEVLSKFLGFNVELPARLSRTAHSISDIETTRRLHKTYESLDSKIATMPDYILNRTGN